MNVFTNYLEKLGSNFLVSAMVPSLATVVASLLVFDPIFHVTALFEQEKGLYQLIGFGLFVFLFTVIIGFTLTALNTYILKLYEGYVFFHHVPFMHRRMMRSQVRKARTLMHRREVLRKRIEALEKTFQETTRTTNQLKRLRQLYFSVTAEFDHNYPQNLNEILPTQFGNILKASESYPGQRYGLDGVEFWPRLIHVIPPEYRNSIDNTRNELSFLVNLSILCIAFYFLCVVAIFYSFGTPPPGLSGADLFFAVVGGAVRYLAAAAIAFACSVFFYRAAIYSVGSFGLMIRSSYDLFRIDLMKKFRLPVPANSDDEFYTWKELNEFVVAGDHSLTFERLDYVIKPTERIDKENDVMYERG